MWKSQGKSNCFKKNMCNTKKDSLWYIEFSKAEDANLYYFLNLLEFIEMKIYL